MRERIRRIGISGRLAILMAILLAVSLGAVLLINSTVQQAQAEKEMLEKSQILAGQMNAAWEFVEKNQDLINSDSDGSENFKGIYCAIAGKSIAARFTRDTDYTIRYVSETPRKRKAQPDEFEVAAFAMFEKGATEYYGIADLDGNRMFRYATPLFVEDSCLDCHGAPAGEMDITGFPKEGLKVGDIGGAISISTPIELYETGIRDNITKQVIGLFAVILAAVVIIYVAILKLIVRPLGQLEGVAGQIEKGDLTVRPESIKATGEIRRLACQLGAMTRQLESSHDHLESEVQERTEQLRATNALLNNQRLQLERMNERLQEESDYKSEFLSIMSHELRTPLTAILAYTEMWEASAAAKDDDEREAVHEIMENGQLLLQMVNNILEMARSAEGRQELVLEDVDLVDVFGMVEHTMGFIARKRGIHFITHVDSSVPVFVADGDKLRRVIENLANNALKFTQSGGEVRVVGTYDGPRRQVIIAVQDNGLGIAQAEISRVFERFTQTNSTAAARYKGSGLGLAVVKDLVERHDGTIEVTSEQGVGSIFSVKLPIAGPPKEDEHGA